MRWSSALWQGSHREWTQTTSPGVCLAGPGHTGAAGQPHSHVGTSLAVAAAAPFREPQLLDQLIIF